MNWLGDLLTPWITSNDAGFWVSLFDSKVVGEILGAFLLSLMLFMAMRLRKGKAVREDGWFYLTPGFLAKFALIGSTLIFFAALIGLIIALRRGYQPTSNTQELISFSPVAALITGFGAMAVAAYIGYFRNKVRWNHTTIEKIVGRRTTRISWKDVQEVQQKKGSDSLWIVAKDTRIKVWTHMNGVEQLIAAMDGHAEAFGLLRQSRPFMESKPRPDHAGSFDPHER